MRRHSRSIPAFIDSLDPDYVASAPTVLSIDPRAARARWVIHISGSQFGDVVGPPLVELSLAREVGWYYCVDSFVANQYFAFLATQLGLQTSMRPITNDEVALAGFTAGLPARRSTRDLHDVARARLIERVLPAPAEAVPLAELVAFKERHADLLGAFRKKIKSDAVSVAKEGDDWVRRERQNEVEEELAEQVDEIIAAMKVHRWRQLGLGTLLMVPSIASLSDAAAAPKGLVLTSAATGLASAIYTTAKEIRAPKSWRHDPLAYAALAHKQFRDGGVATTA